MERAPKRRCNARLQDFLICSRRSIIRKICYPATLILTPLFRMKFSYIFLVTVLFSFEPPLRAIPEYSNCYTALEDYIVLLNATAKADLHHLYNIEIPLVSSLLRRGEPGNYNYSINNPQQDILERKKILLHF